MAGTSTNTIMAGSVIKQQYYGPIAGAQLFQTKRKDMGKVLVEKEKDEVAPKAG